MEVGYENKNHNMSYMSLSFSLCVSLSVILSLSLSLFLQDYQWYQALNSLGNPHLYHEKHFIMTFKSYIFCSIHVYNVSYISFRQQNHNAHSFFRTQKINNWNQFSNIRYCMTASFFYGQCSTSLRYIGILFWLGLK